MPLSLFAVLISCLLMESTLARNSLARTPPMGWMSWEIFRCDIDCSEKPVMCIGEDLYRQQVDALASGGFVAAGYTGIHADDCWEQKQPPRDPKTGQLVPNSTRFPSGMKSLGDYIHSKGGSFGLYTAESPTTCGGYPASANHEQLDAVTFASWGVDYMKVDGCGPADYYRGGYRAMGRALESSGRDITYSCSWPAYIGDNETVKPFAEFIMDGCNLWRNWADIQCNWGSLSGIIDHWGQYGSVLAPFAGPGHWHDMDMLLIGAHCVTEEEERTQMAIWSISAAPLIMGNDLRNVSDASKAILLNKHAIAVNQDPLGQMGTRISGNTPSQIWARNLATGVAVALYNKGGPAPAPPIPTAPCKSWTHVAGGYYEACGGAAGNVGQFTNLTVEAAQAACCANSKCAGFSYAKSSGSGYYKGNAQCNKVMAAGYDGYTKPSCIPSKPPQQAADISIAFKDVNLYGGVEVFDIWAQKSLGTFHDSFTAKNVAYHDTAFLRLTKAQ